MKNLAKPVVELTGQDGKETKMADFGVDPEVWDIAASFVAEVLGEKADENTRYKWIKRVATAAQRAIEDELELLQFIADQAKPGSGDRG